MESFLGRRKFSFFEDKIIGERLGAYVYLLIDPRTNKVFYVGKAGGRDGKGNVRPNAHLVDTASAQKMGAPLSIKQKTIVDIWNAGEEPKIAIVRRQLAKEEIALEVEAALIDVLKLFNMAEGNVVLGHGDDRGLLIGASEINAVVGAQRVAPLIALDNVWLFNIGNEAGKKENRKSPSEAVRGNWDIATPQQPGLAVGLIDGVSHVVYQVSHWDNSNERTKKGTGWRKRFDGHELNEHNEIGAQLLHKDFKRVVDACPAWKWKGILCVYFDGKGYAVPVYNGPKNIMIALTPEAKTKVVTECVDL